MSELKPCPFCGGEAELLKMGSGLAPQTVGFGKHGNSIICKTCRVETDECRSILETINKWNKRVDP
jgi:Lar family restriction alleviation protein